MEICPSYYEASVTRPPSQPSLKGDETADVCVIGGGFTGMSCALQLALAGRKVVLLESELVAWGASGRNGGQFIKGYSTDNLQGHAKAAGVDEKFLFDLSLQAIDLLRRRVRDYQIDCQLKQGYMLAAIKAKHCLELEERRKKLQSYGYDTCLLDSTETRNIISSRRFCGAMFDENSGHLHPLKYALGLAQAAIMAGVKVYENTKAVGISQKNNKITVMTNDGAVICNQAVLAGNAYQENIIPRLRARIMPVGTYIAATEDLGEAADNLITNGAGVCDMNFVLDYFRCLNQRMLFGARVSYSNIPPSNLKENVRARMELVFPQLSDKKIEYIWGGLVAITQNRFPDIGRHDKNIYYAQGYSGHGLAMSGFAGAVVADAIIGDSEKFDVFSRIRHRPFPGGRMFGRPLLVLGMLYYRLRDLL